jgi:HSP20 family protein
MPDRRQQGRRETPIDIGISGLLKGLGDLVERLSELADTDETTVNRSGEFTIKGLNENARAVYGVSIRTGIGGIPSVERFGNLRTTEAGPEVAEIREPLVDLFDEEAELVVVAELPGVSEDEISIAIQGDILILETTGARKFARDVLLPSVVDETHFQQVYRNGILEIRLKKR